MAIRPSGLPRALGNKPSARPGFTIVECILLILILGIAVEAILSSAIWASSLGTFSREELKAHFIAVGLFDTLEAIPPASFDVDFDGAVREAIIAMGGNGDCLHGHKVTVDNIASANGVRTVELTLSASAASKKAPLVMRKSINSLSEKTVGDLVDG
ncbi:MAG: hypothetical protein LBQ90_04410 [Synergistaceae bacterium]|jgi:hypothetical protein|nr:hypothetical protein [Synergistaceae bacterium]